MRWLQLRFDHHASIALSSEASACHELCGLLEREARHVGLYRKISINPYPRIRGSQLEYGLELAWLLRVLSVWVGSRSSIPRNQDRSSASGLVRWLAGAVYLGYREYPSAAASHPVLKWISAGPVKAGRFHPAVVVERSAIANGNWGQNLGDIDHFFEWKKALLR